MESKSKIYWTINVHNRSTLMVKYTAGTNYGYGLWSFTAATCAAMHLRLHMLLGVLGLQGICICRCSLWLGLCVCVSLCGSEERNLFVEYYHVLAQGSNRCAQRYGIFLGDVERVCPRTSVCQGDLGTYSKGCWLQGLSFTGGGRDGKTWQAAASIV